MMGKIGFRELTLIRAIRRRSVGRNRRITGVIVVGSPKPRAKKNKRPENRSPTVSVKP